MFQCYNDRYVAHGIHGNAESLLHVPDAAPHLLTVPLRLPDPLLMPAGYAEGAVYSDLVWNLPNGEGVAIRCV